MAGTVDRRVEEDDHEDGREDDDESNALLERAFHRWPLPALRRQLMEHRTALARAEHRVVASARMAGQAQEDLHQLSKRHVAMREGMEVLRRELASSDDHTADLVSALEARLREAQQGRQAAEAAADARLALSLLHAGALPALYPAVALALCWEGLLGGGGS